MSGNTVTGKGLRGEDVKKPQVKATTRCRPEFFNT